MAHAEKFQKNGLFWWDARLVVVAQVYIEGFRISGFGFRSALGKLSLQSRFRVSGFAVRNQH